MCIQDLFVCTHALQALSDAQQFLFEERQRLLLLQAENDELKLQEIQDRQRIQQLLAMTQPLEQTVTYKQGGPPNSITAYPKASAGFGAAGGATSTAGPRDQRQQQQQQKGAGPAGAGSSGECVLRTVFLPTVDSDFLLLKVESLQAQLKEQVCQPHAVLVDMLQCPMAAATYTWKSLYTAIGTGL